MAWSTAWSLAWTDSAIAGEGAASEGRAAGGVEVASSESLELADAGEGERVVVAVVVVPALLLVLEVLSSSVSESESVGLEASERGESTVRASSCAEAAAIQRSLGKSKRGEQGRAQEQQTTAGTLPSSRHLTSVLGLTRIAALRPSLAPAVATAIRLVPLTARDHAHGRPCNSVQCLPAALSRPLSH